MSIAGSFCGQAAFSVQSLHECQIVGDQYVGDRCVGDEHIDDGCTLEIGASGIGALGMGRKAVYFWHTLID
ncbi:14443_t:CDS:2 [Gigaspora rosea]|nr:14443_t:CDS:2 [Gigaspora rosea]